MSAACARARERFSLYGEDRLDPEERRDVREHLRACRACAEEATASDPSLLFAALPAEEVSAEEVERVVSAVRTGVALRRAEKKLARSPRRIAAIGSAAAVVALTLLLPGLPETPDRRSA
ncbi:MAG: zf-HC2 domain-containing protein, partial [Thermoanaerobaculia bacterium]|nr:zf-HC2 domain-containing protein [Thermoanaerobaculia bacterium]